MTNALSLGIDIGTSGVRAIAIDAAGAVRGQAGAAMAGEMRPKACPGGTTRGSRSSRTPRVENHSGHRRRTTS